MTKLINLWTNKLWSRHFAYLRNKKSVKLTKKLFEHYQTLTVIKLFVLSRKGISFLFCSPKYFGMSPQLKIKLSTYYTTWWVIYALLSHLIKNQVSIYYEIALIIYNDLYKVNSFECIRRDMCSILAKKVVYFCVLSFISLHGIQPLQTGTRIVNETSNTFNHKNSS